jgi:hypothetical protein
VFRYETQVMPPAPFVKTQVINPLTVNHFILTLNGKDLTFELQDP